MLTLRQETDYPVNGKISLRIGIPKSEKFELKLRIPSCHKVTSRAQWVTGSEVKTGSYLSLVAIGRMGYVIDGFGHVFPLLGR